MKFLKKIAISYFIFGFIFLLLFFVVIIGGTDSSKDYRSGQIGGADIVTVALAEEKEENNGGEKFWSYMGFQDQVAWCASFVSWCANECGYIENGIIPKSAWCNDFRTFYKGCNRWKTGKAHGGTYVPQRGDLILFDWAGDVDSDLDHIGIVVSSDGKQVVTIEGNTSDAVGQRVHTWDSSSIIGYGMPDYSAGGGFLGESGQGGYKTDLTQYTALQMDIIYAIIQQEDNGSYEGALAVISVVMNRTESLQWSYNGTSAWAQLTAPGQFCYSFDENWKQWLGGKQYDYVRRAVDDCLKRGIRNHEYTSFRSVQGNQTGIGGRYIPDENGNYYFN